MTETMRKVAVKRTGRGKNKKVTPRKSLGVVFEHLPMNLEQHLEARDEADELTAGEVLQISLQILRAAAHLHAHGLVHFDLKLNNFLCDPRTGRVVLSDFGTAKKVRPDAHWRLRMHPMLPPEGNPAHRAPEVIAAVDRIVKSEAEGQVWVEKQAAFACGVLLYEVAMSAHPYGEYPGGLGPHDAHGALESLEALPDWEEVARFVSQPFAQAVRGLVRCAPGGRSSIAATLLELQQL